MWKNSDLASKKKIKKWSKLVQKDNPVIGKALSLPSVSLANTDEHRKNAWIRLDVDWICLLFVQRHFSNNNIPVSPQPVFTTRLWCYGPELKNKKKKDKKKIFSISKGKNILHSFSKLVLLNILSISSYVIESFAISVFTVNLCHLKLS